MTLAVVAAGVGIVGGVNAMAGNPLGLGGGGGQQGQQAQQMVDPFAPYRASYAQLLNQYMGLGVGGPTGGVGGGGPNTYQPGQQFSADSNPLSRSLAGTGRGIPAGGNPLSRSLDARLGTQGQQGGTVPAGMMDPSYGMSDPAYIAGMNSGMEGVKRAHPGASGAELLALQNYGVNYADQYQTQMFNELAMLSGAGVSPAAGGMAGITAQNQQNQASGQGLGMILGGLSGMGKYFGNNPESGGTTPVTNTDYFGPSGGSLPGTSGGMGTGYMSTNLGGGMV